MQAFRFKAIFLIMIFLCPSLLECRKIILEFKGAYFLPTNHTLRKAYNNGSALYGPELTVQLGKKHHWTKNIYGFISADYFQKKGHALGLCDSTTLRLVPLTVGLKYIIPAHDRVDMYCGLGFESLFLQTHTRRACVTAEKNKWTFGGITELGTYLDLGRHIILNVFFGYRFIQTPIHNFYGPTTTVCKADLSSALFGIGLGYRF